MRWTMIAAIVAFASHGAALRAEVVGTIWKAQGEVYIVGADGVERPAKVNDPVMRGESIRTGKNGRVAVVHPDQTTTQMGPKGSYNPGEILGFGYNPPEHGWAVTFFKWLAKWLPEPQGRPFGTPGGGGGIRGDIGSPGPEFILSLSKEGDALVTELSVLSGEVRFDAINYPVLPDRYFWDPLYKSFDGLNLSAVLAETTADREMIDLLGIGSPVTVGAGYWSRIVGEGPPLPPQFGLAPGHANAEAELAIPEPASLWLLMVGIQTIYSRRWIKSRKLINT